MPDGTPLRSDDASQAAPLCPADRAIGTHAMDYSDRAFHGLPDISSGRTLQDAIDNLNWTAEFDLAGYGAAWVAEMRDIGCSVLRVRGEDGPEIQVMYPCDSHISERGSRGAALAEHMFATDAGRDLVLQHLAVSGSSYGHMMRGDA